MKQRIVSLVLVLSLIGTMMACSSEEPVDLEAVQAEMTTNPETVIAGSEADMKVTVTGMKVSDTARATFDVRIGDEPVIMDAIHEGDGVFSGAFTFPGKGVYTVYIHLYEDDIHITKKKQVDVQ